MSVSALTDLVARKKVVVCVGSGGVGKTTTSAAMAVAAARAGRNVLVLTIDPARRLANALGLAEFGNDARLVDLSSLDTAGARAGGSMAAMMLDMKQTFDDMVNEYIADPAERQKLHGNRLYKSLSNSLAGVQEYMAVSKLYDVHHTGKYDLVILDTPPSAHALDFLNAPTRFVEFLDNDALQWLLKNVLGASRVGFKALFDLGSGYILKALTRIAGGEVLKDIAEFVSSFEPLFHGFKARADKVNDLLRSSDLGFIVVTAPTQGQIDEALGMQREIAQRRLHLLGTVVNRAHRAVPFDVANVTVDLEQWFGTAALAQAALDATTRHNRAAKLEREQLERLVGNKVLVASELREDIHDLKSLLQLATNLDTPLS